MSVPVNEGDILAGKYRVEKVLGMGGMGVVVAATHLQLEQRVALKFLLPEAIENPEVVERFAREARAAVKIDSEHVARVIDVGQLESGVPYMVMEYLNGRDLSAALAERGTFSIEDAVEYVLQACEAIAQAHALGIVHRDLKPSNLFLTTRPDGTASVKVLDFGISKVGVTATSPAEMSLTSTAAVMGSPTYMSPEQMRASRDVDPRADIWALGVILYELLTGDPPFVGATMPELCASILKESAPRIRSARFDVPELLEFAIARCLEKNPAARFNNVAELTAALVEFAPKRARVSAERTARVLRGAGVMTASLPPLASHPPERNSANLTVASAKADVAKPPANANANDIPITTSTAIGTGPVVSPAPVAASTAGAWSQASGKALAPLEAPPAARSKLWIVGALALGGAATFLAMRLAPSSSKAEVLVAPPSTAAAVTATPTVSATPTAGELVPPKAVENSAERAAMAPSPAATPPATAAASAEPPAARPSEAPAIAKGEMPAVPVVKARPKPAAAPPKPADPPATPATTAAPTKRNPLSIEIK